MKAKTNKISNSDTGVTSGGRSGQGEGRELPPGGGGRAIFTDRQPASGAAASDRTRPHHLPGKTPHLSERGAKIYQQKN